MICPELESLWQFVQYIYLVLINNYRCIMPKIAPGKEHLDHDQPPLKTVINCHTLANPLPPPTVMT